MAEDFPSCVQFVRFRYHGRNCFAYDKIAEAVEHAIADGTLNDLMDGAMGLRRPNGDVLVWRVKGIDTSDVDPFSGEIVYYGEDFYEPDDYDEWE